MILSISINLYDNSTKHDMEQLGITDEMVLDLCKNKFDKFLKELAGNDFIYDVNAKITYGN